MVMGAGRESEKIRSERGKRGDGGSLGGGNGSDGGTEGLVTEGLGTEGQEKSWEIQERRVRNTPYTLGVTGFGGIRVDHHPARMP